MQFNDFKIRQALVTLDLSEIDNNTIKYLNFMNETVNIDSMYFMHVVKKMNLLGSLFRNDQDKAAQLTVNEDLIKAFSEEVDQVIKKAANIHIEYSVQMGNPLHKIVQAAKNQHADLVVVGKKTRAMSSGVLGRNIARRSPSSVIFIPQTAPLQLKTIIVPVDFSANSGRALLRAFEINNKKEKPAKIICAHIYELPDLSIYTINKTHKQLQKIIEADMQEAFDHFLEKYVPNLKDLVERIVVERTHVSTAGHLTDAIKTWKADLVIIGAKGHSPIETLLLGSVTEKFILLNETVPTLIVR